MESHRDLFAVAGQKPCFLSELAATARYRAKTLLGKRIVRQGRLLAQLRDHLLQVVSICKRANSVSHVRGAGCFVTIRILRHIGEIVMEFINRSSQVFKRLLRISLHWVTEVFVQQVLQLLAR